MKSLLRTTKLSYKIFVGLFTIFFILTHIFKYHSLTDKIFLEQLNFLHLMLLTKRYQDLSVIVSMKVVFSIDWGQTTAFSYSYSVKVKLISPSTGAFVGIFRLFRQLFVILRYFYTLLFLI